MGLVAEFERAVTEADVLDFAAASGDSNPLHVDAAYAAGTRFGRRIVHGAFQVGLASALVGMHLPGRHVLLGSANALFPAPLYFPSYVSVRGAMTAWNPLTRGGQLRIVVLDKQAGVTTAEVVVAFTLHEAADSPTAALQRAGGSRCSTARRRGDGGRGWAGLGDCAWTRGHVHGAGNRPSPGTRSEPGRCPARPPNPGELEHGSLGGDGRCCARRQRHLYGVVHAAWPGVPHGGLLQARTRASGSNLNSAPRKRSAWPGSLQTMPTPQVGVFVAPRLDLWQPETCAQPCRLFARKNRPGNDRASVGT